MAGILRQAHHLEVINLAQAGATVETPENGAEAASDVTEATNEVVEAAPDAAAAEERRRSMLCS